LGSEHFVYNFLYKLLSTYYISSQRGPIKFVTQLLKMSSISLGVAFYHHLKNLWRTAIFATYENLFSRFCNLKTINAGTWILFLFEGTEKMFSYYAEQNYASTLLSQIKICKYTRLKKFWHLSIFSELPKAVESEKTSLKYSNENCL
jgi:hypothetical protein